MGFFELIGIVVVVLVIVWAFWYFMGKSSKA